MVESENVSLSESFELSILSFTKRVRVGVLKRGREMSVKLNRFYSILESKCLLPTLMLRDVAALRHRELTGVACRLFALFCASAIVELHFSNALRGLLHIYAKNGSCITPRSARIEASLHCQFVLSVKASIHLMVNLRDYDHVHDVQDCLR